MLNAALAPKTVLAMASMTYFTLPEMNDLSKE